MSPRNSRSLSRLDLTLIRIIISGYFMAVSIEVIDGLHPKVLFVYMQDQEMAAILGSFLMFMGSYLLMCGLAVRLVSIYLALLVLDASIMQNFVLIETHNFNLFWQDLVLVAALMLNYGTQTRRELKKAAFVQESYKVRRAMAAEGIYPRRITPKLDNPPQLQEDGIGDPPHAGAARERPLNLQPPPENIKPENTKPAPTPPSRAATRFDHLLTENEDDVENIFAV